VTDFQREVLLFLGPVRALGHNVPLIRFFVLALYIVCLFISYTIVMTYPYLFLSLFPYLSPPLLIFSFGNRPTLFPGRMSQMATKPGFIFSFILCCGTFILIGECVLLLC